MWCEHCHQNVTGVASQSHDCVCCSQCRRPLPVEVADRPAATPLPCPADEPLLTVVAADEQAAEPHSSAPLPRPALEDWELDEDLRRLERLLKRNGTSFTPPAMLRFDAPALGEGFASQPAVSTSSGLRDGLSMLLVCAGLAALACGLMLLGWTWFGGRADLLIPGLAAAAVGQFVLLGGLLLQGSRTKNEPAAGSSASAPTAEHWLQLHRRVDEILRSQQQS